MSSAPPDSYAATPVSDAQRELSPPATCPLCHTVHPSMTAHALEAGGSWECIRCGQRWDAARLAKEAAYAAWVVEHDTSR